jgi:hypothetical protein
MFRLPLLLCDISYIAVQLEDLICKKIATIHIDVCVFSCEYQINIFFLLISKYHRLDLSHRVLFVQILLISRSYQFQN